MKKTIQLLIVALSFGLAFSAHAATVNPTRMKVDYASQYKYGLFPVNGSFSGQDSNQDGFLKWDELDAFNATAGSIKVGLSQLIGFGDYDINNNTWINNTITWNGFSNLAWFSWYGTPSVIYSVNSIHFDQPILQVGSGVSPVPVPAAVWLFGSALLSLAGIKRKKAISI